MRRSDHTGTRDVEMRGLSTVEEALAGIAAGLPVLVTDDENRENEGDVVLAADRVTDEWMAWTIRHTSGVVCVPMEADRADALGLPPMVADNEDPKVTAYTVSVDARHGVATGISAADRARTARVLADGSTSPGDLTRPGHLFPLRARDGGVLARAGHTEAAVDLCRLAGLTPVGAIAELCHDDGTMMRLPSILRLGTAHGLPVVTIEQLIRHRERHDRVVRGASTSVPTSHGRFDALGYRDVVTGDEHLVLVSPHGWGGDAPLVRVHSECLTGDVFGSRRCDCGPQLARSLELVAAQGGAVVYLRGHEGRGVGLVDKLRAYAVQDNGLDTVDAQTELGLPVDARDFGAAAAVLHDLDVTRVRLLTNNPRKVEGLERRGITVDSVIAVSLAPHPDNERYLRTKRDRMGHTLLLDESPSPQGRASA